MHTNLHTSHATIATLPLFCVHCLLRLQLQTVTHLDSLLLQSSVAIDAEPISADHAYPFNSTAHTHTQTHYIHNQGQTYA